MDLVAIILIVSFICWLIAMAVKQIPSWVKEAAFFVMVVCIVFLLLGVGLDISA